MFLTSAGIPISGRPAPVSVAMTTSAAMTTRAQVDAADHCHQRSKACFSFTIYRMRAGAFDNLGISDNGIERPVRNE
jgi:hypothetical protein